MSTSELHSRLEHLVSYSSQLIFVSNDKINHQSKIVDAFLGNQAENTEVALIDAKQTTFLQDYRKQLFTQLIGISTTTDFERPLNQLLSALNDYEGPILIIVSHAENLPQKFLQELWELVLQSRFAANKQHLNVLLFTPPEWAEQAKAWLPTSGGNKPILLNSSSILSATETGAEQIEQTDLEQLISAKREQFAERIRGRASQYEAIQPVLHKPWLAGLIMLLFVSVFGGMLYWQYPEVANSWWQRLGEVFATPTEDSIPQAAKIVPEATSDSAQLIEISAKQAAQQNTHIVNAETVPAPSEELIPRGPEALVTDWKKVLKQIDSANTSQLTQSGADKLYKVPVVADNSLTVKTIVSPAQTNSEQVLISQAEKILKPKEDFLGDDYPLEDITSEKPGEKIVVEAPASTSQDALKPTPEISDIQGLRNYNYNENTLLKLPTNQYVLQITGMRNVVLMQTYIEQYQLNNQLWVYKTQRNGIDWFVLLHNQAYASLAQAKEAVSSLPQALRQGPPFPKTTKQVHQEINR